ncbi:hypothetical protein CGRA01v4_12756 [Colletotrichum graminicola]|nr:hypothetical protein CGRA01v4_12756 [Colletotrichum graminicola]
MNAMDLFLFSFFEFLNFFFLYFILFVTLPSSDHRPRHPCRPGKVLVLA